MGEFKREIRYVVLKLKDIEAAGLSPSQIDAFYAVCDKVSLCRGERGSLGCVVVEKDWPEYEPTWKAIEQRMTAASNWRATDRDALAADNARLREAIEDMRHEWRHQLSVRQDYQDSDELERVAADALAAPKGAE